MVPKKDLTLFEAASIITGFGIGGGVMAVPYLASLNGVFPFIILLAVAFFLSVIFHLIAAEIMMRDSKSNQLIEIFHKYLFRARGGAVFTWIFFILILMAFITNLSACIAGGGEILRDLLGIPVETGHIITYLLSASVVFFGLKVVGLSEKFAVIGIILLVGVLVIGSRGLPFKLTWIKPVEYKEPLALFGMIMFSFTSLFSIPQAVEGLQWNPKLIPKSIILGLFINLCIVTAVTLSAMGVSGTVTRIAISGWSQALGNWAFILGSLFVLLAILTSYWSISFALAVIVKERLKWGDRSSWLLATIPSLAIAVTNVTDFMGFMRITGGAIALLIAILIIPLYHNTKKYGDVKNPQWKLKILGNWFFQTLVLSGFILMALGSLIEL